MRANPSEEFWHGKRVLLTGHTGFKGSWLSLWLHQLGAEVFGVSLPPKTMPNLFELAKVNNLTKTHFCDIRNEKELAKIVRLIKPEIVFHLAAQPLVRASYRYPLDTFSTNIQGTANLLDALRDLSCVRVVVVITTDKVYKNMEWSYPYREDDILGGHDPYSASKASAELITASYRDAFLAKAGVAVASARAGNVIGGGDWSEDRLIPDAIRAWNSGAVLDIRRPDAIRPWQHVLEPLLGYILLGERLWRHPEDSGPFNFGPLTHEAATVRDVIHMARDAYGEGNIHFGSNQLDSVHEAGSLSLEISKSRQYLSISPRWSLNMSIQRTMAWYRGLNNGLNVASLCKDDLQFFIDT